MRAMAVDACRDSAAGAAAAADGALRINTERHFLELSKASKKGRLNVLLEAQTKKTI